MNTNKNHSLSLKVGYFLHFSHSCEPKVKQPESSQGIFNEHTDEDTANRFTQKFYDKHLEKNRSRMGQVAAACIIKTRY